MNSVVGKFVVEGWTCGNEPPRGMDKPGPFDCYTLPEIYRAKGRRCDWGTGAWPPIKVRVTIEYLSNAQHHAEAGRPIA